MIRNRLSAQASREKKRDQLDYYEKANEVLQQNNEDLLRKVKDLSTKNQNLHQEVDFLKERLKQFEPNQMSGGKKTVMIFVIFFFIGIFFIKSPKIELNTLTNSVGRVLTSLDKSSVNKENLIKDTEPKIGEMKRQEILYQSEMRNLFTNLKLDNSTNDMVRSSDESKEIKPKLEKGFIFHFDNEEDTIYFMCPKLYPLFPTASTTSGKKSLNMTFLIPLDSYIENDKTIIKLSKFSAKEIVKSEAFLNL